MKRKDLNSGKEYELRYVGLENLIAAMEGKKLQPVSTPWPKFRGIDISVAVRLDDGTWLLETTDDDNFDCEAMMIAREVK